MPAILFSIALVAVVLIIRWRRKQHLENGITPSGEVDNYTGLGIILFCALTIALIPATDNGFADAVKDVIKMVFGAIGALYLKNGYEKQEKAILEKALSTSTNSKTTNYTKTTLIYQHEQQATPPDTTDKTNGADK
jgi:hypothetical protein